MCIKPLILNGVVSFSILAAGGDALGKDKYDFSTMPPAVAPSNPSPQTHGSELRLTA
jgi:hypothetical protein